MRKAGFTLFLLLALISRVGGSEGEVEFRIAALAPERSVWGEEFRRVARELEEQTSGRLKLKLYLGGIQGDERTVLRKIRIGQLHGAVFMGQGLSLVCPDALTLNLPLLFEDQAEAEFVFAGLRSSLGQLCREKGYEALVWPQIGFSYLFSREPVRTVDALRRSKPWLMQDDPVSESLFEALQVTPVPTAVANVLTGLQTGLIHTIFSPPAGLIALQWHTRVKYRLDLKITYSFGVFVISKRKWDALPGELQDVMRSLFEKRNAELDRKTQRQNEEALRVIEKEGIATISVAEDSRVEFIRATGKVGEDLAGKVFSREVLDKAKSLRAEYRRKRGPR